MPLLHRAISDLSACIDGIAQATADDHAKQQLADGIGRLVSACASVRLAALSYDRTEPDAEPEMTTQPAQLSAADFPAVMTADVLQAASSPPAQASGPAATPPARTRASRPHPGSSPPR